MNFKKIYAVVLAAIASFATHVLLAEQLSPPPYNVTDQFGVNFATGQVSTSLVTLQIGSLSHSISSSSNSYMPVKGVPLDSASPITLGLTYAVASLTAYNDKYGGNARYEQLGRRGVGLPGHFINLQDYVYVMAVHDADSSARFLAYLDNQPQTSIPRENDITRYRYVHLYDPRHTLDVTDGKLIWTKPNGAITEYTRYTNHAGAKGYLSKMQYPNGLVINIQQSRNGVVKSVTTNNGFILKYVYEADPRELPVEKQGALNNIEIDANAMVAWPYFNPKTVVGINLSEMYCSTDQHQLCDSAGWPKVEFLWPAGMPRAFYVGESTFAVTDYLGGITEYNMEAMDRRVDSIHEEIATSSTGYYFYPRIKSIKTAKDKVPSVFYEYENVFSLNPLTGTTPGLTVAGWFEQEGGRLKRAWGERGEQFYSVNRQGGILTVGGKASLGVKQHGAGGDSNIKLVARGTGPYPGVLAKVRTHEMEIYFEDSLRNRVLGIEFADKPREEYLVDGRGNISVVQKYTGVSDMIAQTIAVYPAECTAATRATCNQASAIIERADTDNPQLTRYTYHASGQIESITLPADDHGINPQTRYSYTSKTAKIKNSLGVLVDAEGAILLKTSERYCINSQYDGDIESGSCDGNDEVETLYEYEHNNLLLTAVIVNAKINGILESRRTCYQYDKRGNQIGKTLPKANLTSCNF